MKNSQQNQFKQFFRFFSSMHVRACKSAPYSFSGLLFLPGVFSSNIILSVLSHVLASSFFRFLLKFLKTGSRTIWHTRTVALHYQSTRTFGKNVLVEQKKRLIIAERLKTFAKCWSNL
jgi:hypothetical protein